MLGTAPGSVGARAACPVEIPGPWVRWIDPVAAEARGAGGPAHRGRGIGRTAETGRSRPPVGSPSEERRQEESSMTG